MRVPASLPALSLEPGAVYREERKSTQIPQKERFFGRAWASHPRQPLQASSHPLFICEGRLTHPARLHTTKPGPRTHEGGRACSRANTRKSYCRITSALMWTHAGLSSFCRQVKIWFIQTQSVILKSVLLEVKKRSFVPVQHGCAHTPSGGKKACGLVHT